MKNIDVRMMITENGLRYKDVAKEIGISREWLSKLLRFTLTPDNKIRIMEAIDRLMKGSDQ